MKNLLKFSLIFLIFCISNSCSKNIEENQSSETSETPEILYQNAMLELEQNNLDIAKTKFDEIELKFPLSNEAIQSQIMSAFIDYGNMNYNEAIFNFNIIINRYPSHKILTMHTI